MTVTILSPIAGPKLRCLRCNVLRAFERKGALDVVWRWSPFKMSQRAAFRKEHVRCRSEGVAS
jgi:hypothetical protein